MVKNLTDPAGTDTDTDCTPAAKHCDVPVPPAPENTRTARPDRFHTDFALDTPVTFWPPVAPKNTPLYMLPDHRQKRPAAHEAELKGITSGEDA